MRRRSPSVQTKFSGISIMDLEFVRIELTWDGFEGHIRFQVYKGMRLWLQEREIVHSFEYDNGRYFPRAVIMDSVSAAAFKLIF